MASRVASSSVTSVKIVGFETWIEGKRFTVYKVVVKIPDRSWLVFRRYNDFYSLHQDLKKSFGDKTPKMPSKRLLGNNFEPKFILERMNGLDDFLQNIFSHKLMMDNSHAREFFALDNPRNAVPIFEDEKIDDADRGASEASAAKKDELQIDLGKSEVTIQDFKLLKVIGKGSFGKVLLAQRKMSDKFFAIKVLEKESIVQRNEARHIMAERNVLLRNARHPFLVGLHFSFQTADRLYLVLDYVNGGELFYHLQRERCFSEARARFYAAEMTSALGYLHSMNIIYRDLKPENILLDSEGHVMITDFGLCKEGIMDGATTATFCGTPEYLAPEMLKKRHYTKSVDWWCLGCVLHEMVFGLPPFYSRNIAEMYDRILHKPLQLKSSMSPAGRSILVELLQKDPSHRLGYNDGANDLMGHEFFQGINWVDLYDRKIPPPWNPHVSGSGDTSLVDPEFTSEVLSDSLEKDDCPLAEHDGTFAGFSYSSEKQP